MPAVAAAKGRKQHPMPSKLEPQLQLIPCLQSLNTDPSHVKGRRVRRQLVAGRRAAARREQRLAQPPGLLALSRLLSRAPHQKHVRAQLQPDTLTVVGSP